MTISVVVATHDRPASLARAIESVLTQDRRPDELIVVNDAAGEIDPRLAERAAAAGVAFRSVRRRPASLPASRNAGLAVARGDLLLVLYDDHELPPDYLRRLVAIFQADADGAVDAICGLVDESPRTFRSRLRDVLMILAGHLRWQPRRCVARTRRLPLALRRLLVPARYLTGGATCMRRNLAERIRFNESLGGYALGEDRDFSYRATQRFAVFVAPSLRMTHHCEPAARPDGRLYGRMIVENFLAIAGGALERGAGKWVIVVEPGGPAGRPRPVCPGR